MIQVTKTQINVSVPNIVTLLVSFNSNQCGLLPINVAVSKPMICAEIFLQESTISTNHSNISEEDIHALLKTFANLDFYYMSDIYIEQQFMEHSPLYAKYKDSLPSGMSPQLMVVSFLKKYFNSFLKLSNEREISLGRQLQIWGEPNAINYKQFKILSKKNTERIIKQFNLKAIEELPTEIREAVASIDLQYRHNANSSNTIGPVMLSSARLREAGLPKTIQSNNDFNRNDLQSDDQLYFYVQPVIRKSTNEKSSIPSQYGENSFYLNKDFAQRQGWISPYIMTKGDLFSYQSSLIKAGFNVENSSSTELIKLLHLNVYTVTDFTKLYRTIIGNYITGDLTLNNEFLPIPTKLLEKLNKKYYPTNDATNNLREFMISLGISGGLMELKVPVAIETKYIDKAL